jgi:beta-phosphoglucomutase-like phosphatase (HAD superfamily)
MIIFDCDGVLVDSEILSCGTDARLMTEAGYPITTESLIAGYIGRPKAEIWAAIAELRGEPWPDGLLQRANDLLVERLCTELEPVRGVARALDAIGAVEGPMAVASSSGVEKLRLSLEVCGLWDKFGGRVFSAEMAARGKPAPDVFLHAVSQCGVDPEGCLVIEDSVAGVTAARAAGMTALGFTGGRHTFPGHAESLAAAGAWAVVGHMDDLPKAVRSAVEYVASSA